MRNVYESPFSGRYASCEMLYIFSPDMKFRTWRRLWIALAKGEQKLGLNITDEQITEMEENAENINFDVADEMERNMRHDVMAHIYAYGRQCPKAEAIIHLGATSAYVGDNTDIIQMREGLRLLRKKLMKAVRSLCAFAAEYKSMPTLGFTHFQPAQLTTVGKRATLWINELMMDIEELDHRISTLRLLGSKGTTGTQASFLELFDNNHEKVKELDRLVAREMGFTECVPVAGQTYSRKTDAQVLSVLSQIAQSASKFANDLRLLQHLKEIEEPFEKSQVGSSAMPYKRNPMRSERICALSRYVILDALNPALTSSTQWLERTLDDSANKRISIPEGFLAVDAILNIYCNIAEGLVVYPKVIRSHVMEELPFMATENIMMRAVKNGGNRQVLHERIRVHSQEAGKRVKETGLKNDLAERIANDPLFGLSLPDIEEVLDPSLYIGRSPEQVDEFITRYVMPRLQNFEEIPDIATEVKI